MFYPARGANRCSGVGTLLLLLTAAFGLSGIGYDFGYTEIERPKEVVHSTMKRFFLKKLY